MIIGDEKVKDRVKNARPGDSAVYVDWDAINSLPEQFQAILGVVEFEADRDFTNVGSKSNPSWYPCTSLMYRIAEKRGITAYGDTVVEPIEESVNISLMEMSDTPAVMKMKTGIIVKKQGAVLQEDGTLRTCPQRIGMYNAWEEAVKLWTKEEADTEGYSRVFDENGVKSYKNGQYTNKCKYDTKWKRRQSFHDLMDRAMGMADTTSMMKVIRELAGLQTGYTTAELAEKKFYFAKIVKSASMLKAEAAANLAALSHGVRPAALDYLAPPPASVQSDPEPEPRDVTPVETESGPVDQRSEIVRVLNTYNGYGLIDQAMTETSKKIIAWVEATPKATEDKVFWPKALKLLADMESSIPESMHLSQRIIK